MLPLQTNDHLYQFPNEETVRQSLFNDKGLRPQYYEIIPRLTNKQGGILFPVPPGTKPITKEEREEVLTPIVNHAVRRVANKQIYEQGISMIALEVLYDVSRGKDGHTGEAIQQLPIDPANEWTISELTGALTRCAKVVE